MKALLEFLRVTLKLTQKPAVPRPLYSSFSRSLLFPWFFARPTIATGVRSDKKTSLIAFWFPDYVDASQPRRLSLSFVTRSFPTKERGGLSDGGEDCVTSQMNIWVGGNVDA